MNEDQTYFYLSGYPLEPGSVVRPGNWGRILRLRRENHADRFFVLLKEMVFELVRNRHYSSLPSRLSANFVFEAIDHLQAFRTRRPLDLAYEVRMVDPGAPSHRVCIAAYDSVTPQDSVEEMEQKAHRYWSGSEIQNPEIITLSSLRIVRAV